MLEVFLRLEAQQRQLKSLLTAPCLRMTDADITTSLRQDWDDIIDEAHGLLGGGNRSRQRRQKESPHQQKEQSMRQPPTAGIIFGAGHNVSA